MEAISRKASHSLRFSPIESRVAMVAKMEYIRAVLETVSCDCYRAKRCRPHQL
jgi:hypothetical protein